jgi:hypothetical protein
MAFTPEQEIFLAAYADQELAARAAAAARMAKDAQQAEKTVARETFVQQQDAALRAFDEANP